MVVELLLFETRRTWNAPGVVSEPDRQYWCDIE
jgi:hypothetical protein